MRLVIYIYIFVLLVQFDIKLISQPILLVQINSIQKYEEINRREETS